MCRLNPTQDSTSKIHKISWINFWLGDLGNDTVSAEWAVFFGEDFKNESSMNREEFISKTNECLDYVRRHCVGCKLFYKPHPGETYEQELLNLSGFEILKNAGISETFLWRNAPNVKYTFSIRSTSALSAYQMGFNSYVFFKIFDKIFHNKIATEFTRAWFKGLPPSSCIEDIDQRTLENKIKLNEDTKFKGDMGELLADNAGNIWIIVDHTGFLVSIISIVKLIKKLDNSRRINLVIMRHHRWNVLDLSEFNLFFNKIIIFSRVFYSLKPGKLFNAIKISRKIKNLDIGADDIIIDFGNHNFISNCFNSYYKNNSKIAFMPKVLEDVYFKTNYLGFLDSGDDFKFTKASFFYNKLFEPLLGLHRTVFKQGGDGHVGNLLRFQKPVTDIYDKVYLF